MTIYSKNGIVSKTIFWDKTESEKSMLMDLKKPRCDIFESFIKESFRSVFGLRASKNIFFRSTGNAIAFVFKGLAILIKYGFLLLCLVLMVAVFNEERPPIDYWDFFVAMAVVFSTFLAVAALVVFALRFSKTEFSKMAGDLMSRLIDKVCPMVSFE